MSGCSSTSTGSDAPRAAAIADESAAAASAGTPDRTCVASAATSLRRAGCRCAPWPGAAVRVAGSSEIRGGRVTGSADERSTRLCTSADFGVPIVSTSFTGAPIRPSPLGGSMGSMTGATSGASLLSPSPDSTGTAVADTCESIPTGSALCSTAITPGTSATTGAGASSAVSWLSSPPPGASARACPRLGATAASRSRDRAGSGDTGDVVAFLLRSTGLSPPRERDAARGSAARPSRVDAGRSASRRRSAEASAASKPDDDEAGPDAPARGAGAGPVRGSRVPAVTVSYRFRFSVSTSSSSDTVIVLEFA